MKSPSCLCVYVNPSVIAEQPLSKHVPAATNTHATIEEMFDASFLCDPCRVQGN
jgi:hypothetical protein